MTLLEAPSYSPLQRRAPPNVGLPSVSFLWPRKSWLPWQPWTLPFGSLACETCESSAQPLCLLAAPRLLSLHLHSLGTGTRLDLVGFILKHFLSLWNRSSSSPGTLSRSSVLSHSEVFKSRFLVIRSRVGLNQASPSWLEVNDVTPEFCVGNGANFWNILCDPTLKSQAKHIFRPVWAHRLPICDLWCFGMQVSESYALQGRLGSDLGL